MSQQNIYKVPIELAKIVASKYRSKYGNKLSKTQPEICSVDSLEDIDSVAAMYVINFCDDAGWIIISADYRHEPVMAFNNDGNFEHSDDIPQGLALWMLASVEIIEGIRLTNTPMPTASEAWYSFIDEFDIEEIPGISLPGYPPPPPPLPCANYPWLTYIKGPLLLTTWGQECSYNDWVPTCNSGGNPPNCNVTPPHSWTGCVATATGQIMKYRNHPSPEFAFAYMSTDHGNAQVQYLLSNIGYQIGMDYGCTNGSSASSAEARKKLDNHYDYDDPDYRSYSFSLLISDIIDNKPVYLDGCRTRTDMQMSRKWWERWKPKHFTVTTYSNCHAWVCDGYRYKYKNCSIPNTETLLHMNWGWHEVDPTSFISAGPDFSGWFRYNDWTIPGLNWNYRFADNMIYNIVPN